MFAKYTKLIVRDPSTGSLVQMLPEVKTANEVDAESSLPVSSSAVASWGEAFVRKGSESETISGDVTFEGRTTYSDDIAMSGHKIVDPSGIELSPASNTDNNGGYIEFRYNNAEESTSRIIESASGTVTINNVNISNGSVSAATFTGALNGNAATTTKLATARTINGTSFDGTGNITTTSWGTARNISISDSDGTNTGAAVSVNGSGNATLKLPAAIKASITGNCSGSSGSCTGNAATATKLATTRAINGTNFDGSAAITTANWGTARNIYVSDSDGTNTGAAVSVNGSANATLKLPATIKAGITGNASTATKLATARAINGTNFDGSAAITTANWGTARNISISDSDGTNTGTAVSVNGSGNATLKLPATIKASITGNVSGSSGSCTGNAATATKLATARSINIQDSSATNTGTAASFDGSGNATIKLPATIKASITGDCSGSSGSCTGNAASATITKGNKNTGSYVTSVKSGNALVNADNTQFATIYNAPTKSYRVGCATWPDNGENIVWYSITNANVSSSTNTVNKTMTWNAGTGILTATGFAGPLTGNVTGNCSGSSGSCTGNAATATKLATARSLWGNNFDGSAAISGTINGTPSIEFKPTATNSNNGGYLDFHYNQSTADYTSRIIESASGTLSINNVTITTGKVVTATTFTGALSGNASTATKLATARNINGVAFDGSANITIADSTKVAKTGDTMTGALTVKPAGPGLKLCNSVVTKGTNPSSNTWTYLELLDNANGRLGWIGNNYNQSGVTTVGMYVRKQDANTESSLGVGYNASKVAYTWAPTPAAADNSTQIATTAWVRGRLHISTADPSGGTDGDIWFKYA